MLRESLTSDRELVFDAAGTVARYGGSRELLVDMIGFFLEDSPTLLAELKDAVRNGDAQGIRDKAHALKGLLAGCGGVRAAQAAQRVENASFDGELSQIDLLRDATVAYRSEGR
jgi:two-component system, sensor histidine kinase and response regulator